ncbi:MAG: Asp-tRNA(Asn)/Glu-tRNA(Gln) amidotransferase subunit GatA, partial [Anaerolineales bacterium]|nr:Asp-tRNA(Asn)/Glu-tRNA(Gln) amidotransferase subunit GatA [Anaerolineales bacterium]
MTALTDLSLLEAASALRKGDVSSMELTEACLARIEVLEPQLHAFLAQTPDLAISQAKAADQRLQEWRKKPEEPLPLTHGIP